MQFNIANLPNLVNKSNPLYTQLSYSLFLIPYFLFPGIQLKTGQNYNGQTYNL